MLILDADDVKQAIDMPAAIAACRRALELATSGKADVPQRHFIDLKKKDELAVSFFMPGFIPDLPALGLKFGALVSSNPARGQPTTPAVTALMDPATGALAALIESTWLTNVKTGASTGVATDLLARKDSATYVVLGAGSIAYHQVAGVLAVRPTIARILLWNRTRPRAERLAAEIKATLRPTAETVVIEAPEAAVREADIVTAATSSHTPVVLGAWVMPGTHVNLTGAHGADMREGDDALVAKAAVATVDLFAGAGVSGDVAGPIAARVRTRESFIDIGQIALGNHRGRRTRLDITWYKSVGMAALDLVIAKAVLDNARAKGIGREMAFHGVEIARGAGGRRQHGQPG